MTAVAEPVVVPRVKASAGRAQPVDHRSSLLRLRALVPALPSGFVRRPRLESLLSAGEAHPLRLLTAGPGYGKTSTVASWTRLATGPVAWLTVDETDNDLPSFWSDVLGALAIGGALPTGSLLARIGPGTAVAGGAVRQLHAGLAELAAPVTLVIDDWHRLRDEGVLESLGWLLEHQPPQLRLLLLGRVDPPLRLNRLRVGGELIDVRAADLAFTEREAAELLAVNGFHLGEADRTEVLGRTQGWAVGLRLAMMHLDRPNGGVAGFSGSRSPVAEYLLEEIVDPLPHSDREFLISTSVVERLTADLARELTGRDEAQRILERLVSQHALVATANGNEWFSVHPLLRDLLRHLLELDRPRAGKDLHVRAARWFADRGEPIPAIRHATAAQAWNEVGRLLTEFAVPLLLSTSGPALVAALEPAAARAAIAPTVDTLLAAAVCAYHRHDFESMGRAAAAVAELRAGGPPDDPAATDLLLTLIEMADARTRRPGALPAAARRLQGLLGDATRRALPTVESYRAIAAANRAIGELWDGDLIAAESGLLALESCCHHLGLGLVELDVQAHLALLDAIHGRLREADRRARAALELAGRRGWSTELHSLGLHAALALTHLARNELDSAGEHIAAGLAVGHPDADMACRVVLAIAAVGLAVSTGDVAAARVAADRMQVVRAGAGVLPPLLERWCQVADAEGFLLAGQPAAAISVLGDPGNQPGYAAAMDTVVRARALVALGLPAAGLDLVEPPAVALLPFRSAFVESRVVAAVAADQLNHETVTISAITDAVDQAQPEGIRRPFLICGPRVAGLVNRHRHLVPRHLEFTQVLVHGAAATPGGAPVQLATELTRRELSVLEYLPTMYKSAEIAADLFISVHTVKSHQRAIYRKLGAATRRDAVDRARELHLL